MATLSTAQQHAIERIVSPERARFDLNNRQQFSFDSGLRPGVRGLNGRTLPDAVIWPEEEQEIVSLVELARSIGLSIVPRGGGTGVYGSAVPVEGGMVVDLRRLAGVVEVSPDEGLATVRAGTRWTELESELAAHGVAPRVSPTSAPSATVGGWLAQGGAGLGSHAFGWMVDNVERARVVGGDGEVHHLDNYDLDSVAAAEGTTGVITEVVLRVRPTSVDTSVLLILPDIGSLQSAISYVADWHLPISSATFVNARGAARLRRARSVEGSSAAEAVRLSEDELVLHLVYSAHDRERVSEALSEVEARTAARRQPDIMAQREWANRFRPLRATFAPGSVPPADVVVPTRNLARFVGDLERRMGKWLAIEGTSVRGWQTVVRVFPTPLMSNPDEASSFTLAVDVVSLAERHGGHGYATGRYFRGKAASILGTHRIHRLRYAQAWLDPNGLMNPGKVVFGNALVDRAVQVSAGVRRIAGGHGRR
ncbi:MAG TPA: FAD-binding oxidoreductase [Chloroflexota bacterium]